MGHIQTLTEADYDAVFSLSEFAFQYKLSAEELQKKKEEAQRHTIWGWMEAGQLAAKVHLIPLSCYINGQAFSMGGVSAVATWPEYRRQGMIKQLLYHALTSMKENGQSISFLHPFAFSFYRKYGWEHAFTEQHDSIPIEQLKRNWNLEEGSYVRRIQPNIPLLHRIYTEFAKVYNGMLVRDEAWWKQRVLSENDQIAVAYNKQGEPAGYMIYNVKENVFDVRELAYTDGHGQKQLLHFIANHDSMAEKVKLTAPEQNNLPLLLDEPRFEQKLVPYFMARIVDVQRFLQEYPFHGEGNLTLVITDDFFPENNGSYQLKITTDETTVMLDQPVDNYPVIHCSIQVFTSMMLAFRRPSDYYQAGRLHGEELAVSRLETVIPNRQPFLADFY
ncbi:GNAT family N-acetyltransferase [Lentibacillus sp. N15]|uniref:GNAT family N-acetyltransferase n=1 Tax=Lentibacillus songyuanensis TaxID=3136161 RepID=UPI0031BA41BA